MEITIRELEDYLRGHYAESGRAESLFMKLVEEVGETAEVLNKQAGRKAADGEDLRRQLGEELADIVHYAFAVAVVSGVELSEAIVEKDRRAAVKYHHVRDLETFVKEQRESGNE